MAKKISFLTILVCLLGFFCSCSQSIKARTIFIQENLHNGDAKFFGDKVVTNVDNKLCIYDFDGTIRQYDVQCNWIDVITDERILVYGNFDHEVGLVCFDQEFNMTFHTKLWDKEYLNIDPALIKIEDIYYLTLTEIKGTVNNADINAENGTYTIQLYCSEDLTQWNFLGDVVSCDSNLEDVKLMKHDGQLYVMYEKEVVDKGASNICIIGSVGEQIGKSWGEEIILLDKDADHEPATIMETSDGFVVFYSCDKEAPGESYMGSHLYYAAYDRNFNLIEKDFKIESDISDGQLLYDVWLDDNQLYYMTAVNYLTDCTLAVLQSDMIKELK